MEVPHIQVSHKHLLQILKRAREEFVDERTSEHVPVTAEMAAHTAVHWLVKSPTDAASAFSELVVLCSRVYYTEGFWDSLRAQASQRLSYTDLVQELTIPVIRDNLLSQPGIRAEDAKRRRATEMEPA